MNRVYLEFVNDELHPEGEIENYKAAFHEHDEDGSGNISTTGEYIDCF